jgi:predicted regulator of Ras-like GTPase activity (Roadblock/LC7/MglB family)/predicted Zn-dependent protease
MQASAKLDERISKCEEILSKNPDSVIFAALSDAYRKQGELGKAFHVCSRGLKSHPDYGAGHLVMAKINTERGMYSEAERELALAVRADGKTRATELLLARILVNKGETRDAKLILERLKGSDPSNEVIAELLQAVKEKEKTDRSGYEVMAAEERWHIQKVVDLADGLRYLKSLPGVMGTLVVGEDGLVLESKLKPGLEAETLGAAVTCITRSVQAGISGVGFGAYEQIMVEAEDFELWIISYRHKVLVLCCDPEASKGALKMRVIELLEHLSRNDE